MPRPWWERWPERLECELGALDAAGIRYRIIEAARAAGYIRLELWPEVDGEPLRLIATFPDLYPYFRFEVAAPDLKLPHHQHPIGKNLCLIGRATRNWDSDDTLAAYVRERVPLALHAGRTADPAAAAGVEEPQAEPFSDYYPYLAGASVLVDSGWALDPAIPDGRLIVGIEGSASRLLRGVILEIRDAAGRLLVAADPALAARYRRRVPARWVRSPSPISAETIEQFLGDLAKRDGRLARPSWQTINSVRLDVIGVVFPEETGWRRTGDGWVFLVRAEELQASTNTKGARGVRPGTAAGYFARSGRAGRDDLVARIPELAPLAERRVALFGLGAIGAPLALDLARAQLGELRAVDPDVVEAGTAVRWPLGVGVAGGAKALILADVIAAHYPYTQVKPYVHRLGSAPDIELPDRLLLDEVLGGADLIVDATAEWGVHHALADLARERGLPYLYAFATPGFWGGLVARIRPERTAGCWICLQHALAEGAIPTPPANPTAPVQPAGCADPTAPGAGFEVAEVAIGAVRLAASTLTGGSAGAYPDVGWDVATVALRDAAGGVIAPRWETFALERHPACPACATR